MVTPFFFGSPQRTLAGILHGKAASNDAASPVVVVAPALLQEGITSHRCLWWLAEKIAAEGGAVLRFDAYGTGDSSGDSVRMTLQGLSDDIATALRWMQAHDGIDIVRQLALRSACIPVLHNASLATSPVDLVLWDPVLSGSALVEEWKTQHRRQLKEAGRYPFQVASPESSDLLGFELAPELLPSLTAFDAAHCVLPAGSRLRVATWQLDEALDGFVQAQQESGIDAQAWVLDAPDRPDWNDASKFEDQLFPRRSAMRIAGLLQEQPSWN